MYIPYDKSPVFSVRKLSNGVCFIPIPITITGKIKYLICSKKPTYKDPTINTQAIDNKTLMYLNSLNLMTDNTEPATK